MTRDHRQSSSADDADQRPGIEPILPSAGERAAEPIAETQPPEPPRAGRSAKRAVTTTLRASLMIQVINMISGIELARGLGVEGRGELAAAMLWPLVVGAISTLGLEESMTFHVARARGRTGAIVGSALRLCMIQSVAFLAITVAIVPLAVGHQGGDVVAAALIYSLYLPLNMFAVTFMGVLNGLHRYGWANYVRLGIGVFVISAQTVLLITGAFSPTVLVIAFVGCQVANFVLAYILFRRAYSGPLSADTATVRQVLGYGIRSHTGTSANYFNQRLDQLVISAFLSASDLGVYVVAVTLTSLTPVFGASVGWATLPNVAGAESPAERALMTRRLLSLTFLASIVLSIPIIVLADPLIHLFFGESFTVGADITRVIAVAAVSLAMAKTLQGVLRGLGRPLAAGLSEALALIATIAGLAILLPTIGLIGAAWASLVAYTVSSVSMLVIVSRSIAISPLRLLVPDRAAATDIRTRLRRAIRSR